MPRLTLPALAADAQALADALTEVSEREAGFVALAEAVVAFDGDGLGQQATPKWDALVVLAKAALE